MKKVVVIEDNTDVRENVVEILELDGYKVEAAHNGKEGVSLVKNILPDLVICDIMMPELDGYGVLYMLQKNKETANIPFIFLTAKAEKSDFRKGMQLGADDYLTKPFTDLDLLSTVSSRIEKSERIKNYYEPGENTINALLGETELNRETIEKMVENRRLKKFKKRDSIYIEGDKPVYLHFIKSGKVKTTKMHMDGKELVTNILQKGDFLGYRELLLEKKYQETAECMEDTEILLIPDSEFKTLINNSREISNQFLKLLSNNVDKKHDDLLQLAYDSVRKRVATTLIDLSGKFEESGNPEIQVSREELASMVGTATESVIRMLSEFKGEGWISVKGSKIQVLDKRALDNMRF